MRSLIFALSVAVGATSFGLVPTEAEAKRLGSGRAAGMQRQMPAKQASPTPPTAAQPGAQPGATAAAPAAAGAAGAAAAAGKRSWMGPIAGLAAGLGLAALFSHLGMGEGLANMVMIALLAAAAFFAIRFIMGRMRGGAGNQRQMGLAGATAGAGAAPVRMPVDERPSAVMQRQAINPSLDTPASATGATAYTAPAAPAATLAAAAEPAQLALPGGMDAADFARLAKQVFIRLQAANDAGDVDDLRRFTTPELFGALRADLLERGQAKQQTDVVQLDAEVVDVAQDDGRDVISVRFHGLIREQAEAGAEPFNELWHLVRPVQGGDWAIAGITPLN